MIFILSKVFFEQDKKVLLFQIAVFTLSQLDMM
jgi:hypothetical protein